MLRKRINVEYGLHCISLSYHVVQDLASISKIMIFKAYLKDTFVLFLLHHLSTACQQNGFIPNIVYIVFP